MHRSQLAGFIIDCRTEDLDAAADFWSGALGMKREAGKDKYVSFAREPNGLNVEVQRVEHESRVHLDIETDNIEAEVARLEKLGARRVRKFERWWVMEAPTGQRFCVVRATRANFAQEANAWE
ncbi:MAG TPA: VOC family protein [Candidatus Cybelea sp.]|nr:VOC family protein [Candidatus Cybelea sp.]